MGCTSEDCCFRHVGVEIGGSVLNRQLSASSQWSDDCPPARGRLNTLDEHMYVKKLASQGKHLFNPNWKTFRAIAQHINVCLLVWYIFLIIKLNDKTSQKHYGYYDCFINLIECRLKFALLKQLSHLDENLQCVLLLFLN